MKISVTSDVHVKQNERAGKEFLTQFLSHQKVLESDYIVFLGDVFDLMIGPKQQYLKKYQFFFDKIVELANQNKTIIYIEGNHDFHITEVFESLANKNIKVVKDKFYLEDAKKTICFEHGDALDFENKAYIRWKKIYSSKAMAFFVKYILPHRFIDYIGNKASSSSKKRSSPKFNYEWEKQKYRKNFEKFKKDSADIFIMGHTHIKDEYILDKKVYLNNGYPKVEQEFLFLNSANWEWVKLNEEDS